jgi:DNA repair protein RadC
MKKREPVMKFSDLPKDERPKARLELMGLGGISNAELISLAIGVDDIQKGYDILSKLDRGIASLPNMSVTELMGLGFSKAQAIRFTAANELFSRARSTGVGSLKIDNHSQVAKFFDDRLRNEAVERCFAMCLNSKGVLGSYFELSVGGATGSIVEASELYRQAIKRAAASVILVHNHPSGDSRPSGPDISVTKRLFEAGKLLDIRFLDHIVVGRGEYTSIRELHGDIFGDRTGLQLSAERAFIVNEKADCLYSTGAGRQTGQPGQSHTAPALPGIVQDGKEDPRAAARAEAGSIEKDLSVGPYDR